MTVGFLVGSAAGVWGTRVIGRSHPVHKKKSCVIVLGRKLNTVPVGTGFCQGYLIIHIVIPSHHI